MKPPGAFSDEYAPERVSRGGCGEVNRFARFVAARWGHRLSADIDILLPGSGDLPWPGGSAVSLEAVGAGVNNAVVRR